MSADQCGSTADCPKTFAAMNLTQKLIAASVIVAAGQWVPGRRLPHVVRLLLAWVPPLLVLAAIRNAFATPTG